MKSEGAVADQPHLGVESLQAAVGDAEADGGEIYYSAALAGAETVPIPSLADAGYLLFYPLAYAALIVLLRERIGSFPVARWLDGLIVGTAIAALAAALALGPIVDSSTSGEVLEVVTNLAYPIADIASSHSCSRLARSPAGDRA